jgi:hypothetical protein
MTVFTIDAPGIHFEDRGDRYVIEIDARANTTPLLREMTIRNIVNYIDRTARRRYGEDAPAGAKREPHWKSISS